MDLVIRIAQKKGLTLLEFFLEAFHWRWKCHPRNLKAVIDDVRKYHASANQGKPEMPAYVSEYLKHLGGQPTLPSGALKGLP